MSKYLYFVQISHRSNVSMEKDTYILMKRDVLMYRRISLPYISGCCLWPHFACCSPCSRSRHSQDFGPLPEVVLIRMAWIHHNLPPWYYPSSLLPVSSMCHSPGWCLLSLPPCRWCSTGLDNDNCFWSYARVRLCSGPSQSTSWRWKRRIRPKTDLGVSVYVVVFFSQCFL